MVRLPILYDAECGFCRFTLAQVLAWDRRERLRPVALQSPEADLLLHDMPAHERMASWHLILPSGEVRSGGAAFAPLLRLLPGGAPLAPIPAAFPVAADRAYRLVAANRHRLGPHVPQASAERARERIARRTPR